jgi:hypothetical protein
MHARNSLLSDEARGVTPAPSSTWLYPSTRRQRTHAVGEPPDWSCRGDSASFRDRERLGEEDLPQALHSGSVRLAVGNNPIRPLLVNSRAKDHLENVSRPGPARSLSLGSVVACGSRCSLQQAARSRVRNGRLTATRPLRFDALRQDPITLEEFAVARDRFRVGRVDQQPTYALG